MDTPAAGPELVTSLVPKGTPDQATKSGEVARRPIEEPEVVSDSKSIWN